MKQRHCGTEPRARRRPWLRCLTTVPAAGIVLMSTGCSTVAGSVATEALGALTDGGEQNDVFGDAGRSGSTERRGPTEATVTSVYVRAPVRGWDAPLEPTPSERDGAYFETDLFGGSCPGLHVDPSAERDVLGSPSPFRLDAFAFWPEGSTDAAHGLVGRMWMGGFEAPETTWQETGLWGMSGGRCGFAGVPLLTFGRRYGRGTLLR